MMRGVSVLGRDFLLPSFQGNNTHALYTENIFFCYAMTFGYGLPTCGSQLFNDDNSVLEMSLDHHINGPLYLCKLLDFTNGYAYQPCE